MFYNLIINCRQIMKNLSIFLVAIIFVGCQSVSEVQVSHQELLYDQGFDGFKNVYVESESEIFELDDEAKTFAKSAIKGKFKPKEQIYALVQHIFSRSDLNLLYRAEANTVANQTFQSRAANCLSMSIMTYALAKELGFGVRFQDIEIPEYWTIREGQSLLNRHINLQILPRPSRENIQFINKGFEVDFDAQATRQHFPKTLLKLNQVVAMFHNNNGADALVKKDYVKAYAYFSAALSHSPNLSSVWANLGYLYRLSGHYDLAERTYLVAIEKDKTNLTAWRNLSSLYGYMGQDEKAKDIVDRVVRKRSDNPFFHVNKGDKAFEKQQWKVALEHYQRALRLNKSYHEVFFGLGKTYYELGNIQRSHYYLKLARKKSRTEEEHAIYQGKINMLVASKAG
jgi:tetratricopeptide (TPR) repeat protein